MMPAIKHKLPSFANDRAEAKFWAAHSVGEFADGLQDLDVQIQPARSEQVALRFYKNDLGILAGCGKRGLEAPNDIAMALFGTSIYAKVTE
jgi:hypothetical protein